MRVSLTKHNYFTHPKVYAPKGTPRNLTIALEETKQRGAHRLRPQVTKTLWNKQQFITIIKIMSLFFYKDALEIPCSESEAARYLGYRNIAVPDKNIQNLIHDCCQEMRHYLSPKCVYEEFELTLKGSNTICFGGTECQSECLSRNLKNCSSVILFAATIGAGVDRLIRRMQAQDSVKAAVMQSVGAMYTESFCNAFNGTIKEQVQARGQKTHPRYSPGYGDVPLTMQKTFFSLLQCNKIGLTLMDTLIMSPEKSVTAFIGIEQV